MSAYQRHKQHRKELLKVIQEYSNDLERKKALFYRTQPSSVPFDKDGGKTMPGSGSDTVDRYLIELEQSGIDARLRTSRELINQMNERIKDDELLLKMSIEMVDQVYWMVYIEHRSVSDVAAKLHFSQSYIYRMLKEIDYNF